MIKFFIKDLIFSLIFTVVLYFVLNFLKVNEDAIPYILGVVFTFIFIFSVLVSFYLFNIKNKLELLKKQIEILRNNDVIVNVFNRQHILKLLKTYIEISRRKNIPLSIMIIDIDDFKVINKNYGHETGDKVLRELALILEKEKRGMDILGRFGGDKFLIAGFVHQNEFHNFGKRIIKKIENHIFVKKTNITVSIGITEFKYNDNLEKLIKRAEEALFIAKQKGGNRVDYLEHFLLFE
ncbi:GGDEF domain-containing protein [Caminibacter sp.]